MIEIPHNVSFNILGTKERLQSLINLNFTVNKLPMADLGNVDFDDEEEDRDDELASIEHKI